jgi:transcriptional regulator with GAF, ATPase, and Fis domain
VNVSDGPEIDGIEQVVRVLVPADPRGSAQKALAHLCADACAHTGAVFATGDDGRLDLRYTAGNIDQTLLDQAHEGWRTARQQLSAGEWWQSAVAGASPLSSGPRPCLLVPLLSSDHVVGLLYLDFLSPERLHESDRRSIARIGRILAACVMAPEGLIQEDDLTSHLARTSARELRHAQLVAHLTATGGNIKEVARRMGKSRPTIYAWMDEFGIPRRRDNRPRRADS